MTVRGPAYYDASYERIIRLKDPVVWGLMRERCARIAPYISGSVLDVACGLGLLADYVDSYAKQGHFLPNGILVTHDLRSYTGVDFSEVATDYGREHFQSAEFITSDVFSFLATIVPRRFDTVVLSEILEHVAHPARLYEMAAAVATKRLIWTVPCNLPAPAHVWPVWPEQAVDLMLSLVDGECVVKEQFGGEDGARWWIVVQDVE